MKKNNRIEARITDEQAAFIHRLEKIMGDRSTAIRFCLNFTRLHLEGVLNTEEQAEKLVTAIEKTFKETP